MKQKHCLKIDSQTIPAETVSSIIVKATPHDNMQIS